MKFFLFYLILITNDTGAIAVTSGTIPFDDPKSCFEEVKRMELRYPETNQLGKLSKAWCSYDFKDNP